MKLPAVDSEGRFESTIGKAPPDWPWVLPALYALNVAPDPGPELSGYSAKLTGEDRPTYSFNVEKSLVEIVGFWNDLYRVVEVEKFGNLEKAQEYAKSEFENLPARYLMYSGTVIEESLDVDLIGTWPIVWTFKNVRDLGVFCAYIYDRSLANHENEFAERFRDSILPAWPLTELISNYK